MSALEIATESWSLAADRAAYTGRRIDKAAENAAYDRMIAAEKAVTA
jgi:hypothetical protein